jgi:hypothetical protein
LGREARVLFDGVGFGVGFAFDESNWYLWKMGRSSSAGFVVGTPRLLCTVGLGVASLGLELVIGLLVEPMEPRDVVVFVVVVGFGVVLLGDDGICCDGRRGKFSIDPVIGVTVAVDGVEGICCDGRRGISGAVCGDEDGRFGSVGATRLTLEVGRFGVSSLVDACSGMLGSSCCEGLRGGISEGCGGRELVVVTLGAVVDDTLVGICCDGRRGRSPDCGCDDGRFGGSLLFDAFSRVVI